MLGFISIFTGTAAALGTLRPIGVILPSLRKRTKIHLRKMTIAIRLYKIKITNNFLCYLYEPAAAIASLIRRTMLC